jgi:uncharacterized membrane protein YbhN (UPF0104 family)
LRGGLALAGAGLLALSVQTVLSALRWQLTARQLGIALGTVQAIREYYLSQVVNQSLPGGMIGDAGRAVRSRGQAGLVAAGRPWCSNGLAGQIAMFVLAVAFLATLAVPGGLDWPRWLARPSASCWRWALPARSGAGRDHLPGAAGRAPRGSGVRFIRALAARSALPGQIG